MEFHIPVPKTKPFMNFYKRDESSYKQMPKDKARLHQENSNKFQMAQIKYPNIPSNSPYQFGFFKQRAKIETGSFFEKKIISYFNLPEAIRGRFLQLLPSTSYCILMKTSKKVYQDCFYKAGIRVSWLYVIPDSMFPDKRCDLKENGEVDLYLPLSNMVILPFEKLYVSQHVLIFVNYDACHDIITTILNRLPKVYREFRYFDHSVAENYPINSLLNLIHPLVNLVHIRTTLSSEEDIILVLNKLYETEYIVVEVNLLEKLFDHDKVSERLFRWMLIRDATPEVFIFRYMDKSGGAFYYIENGRLRSFSFNANREFVAETVSDNIFDRKVFLQQSRQIL